MLPTHGLYGHIRNNNAKSLALIAAFFLLFELLAVVVAVSRYGQTMTMTRGFESMFSRIDRQLSRAARNDEPQAEAPRPDMSAMYNSPFVRAVYRSLWWQTAIGAGCWLFVAWLFFKYAVRKATHAQSVTRREEPRLYNIVENLSILAGLPMPAVYVMESRAMNACAAGLAPSSAMIAVSRGMLERLDDRELEAVVAHELMHIRSGDIRLVAVATLFSAILLRSALMIVEPFAKPRAIPFLLVMFFVAGFMFWLSLALLAWGCFVVVLGGWLVRHSITRARDFMADAGAVELTKNPEALASALRKVEGREELDVDITIDAMLFASAAGGPLSTHPSPRERIEALRGAVPGMTPAADVTRAAGRTTEITWDAVKGALSRSPKWVGRYFVVWPTSLLAFGMSYAVASVSEPVLITALTGMTRATFTGRTPQGLEKAFGLPEGMTMGTFELKSRALEQARARTQYATCFPLDNAAPYMQGSRPFTPVPTDDATMRRDGYRRPEMERVFFAWRGKNVLAASMRQCPIMSCSGKGLDSYRDSLREYMDFRMRLVRAYDRLYGAPGLAFAQSYFTEPRDIETMSDLATRVARGQIVPADFPEAYDAIHLATTKPVEAFLPCRSEAEWRASAFPAPAHSANAASGARLFQPLARGR